MNAVEKAVKEIKSLRVQGATAVARACLLALQKVKAEEIEEAAEQLGAARPTEPLARNCLAYVLWQISKGLSPARAVNLMLTRLIDIESEIIRHGQGLIKPNMKIFTHCHSAAVVGIFKAAKQNQINFSVYLTETEPKRQGRLTAKELTKLGIEAIMMVDSAAAYTLSHLDKTDIDLVLLGADAISADASCVNKIGSFSISLAAEEAKIPLYVAASLLKFDPQAKTVAEIKIEERDPGEVWQNPPSSLRIINPAFDPIPADKINSYVTEFGLIKPPQVAKKVAKNYPWVIKKLPRSAPVASHQFSYLSLDKKPQPARHIIATFRVEPATEAAAEEVASESSIGTWTEINRQTKECFQRLGAKVFELNRRSKIIKIAYPLALFEPGNIPQLLSSVAGNIFGMKAINHLYLEDLELPEKYVRSFPGPSFGLAGVRHYLKIKDRPILGSIIKPKEGLTAEEHVVLAGELFQAGLDLVKDDENLTSPDFNPFDRRLALMMKAISQLKTPKIYAFNITAPYELMVRRAQSVQDFQSQGVMVDILTVGFSSLQSLRQRFPGLIIHGHRAMHAALTRNRKHGISMMVLAKLSRLAGVDQLHTGTVIGKMEADKKSVLKINQFLRADWYGLKPVLPIASGGLYPALIPQLIKILGRETVFTFGGGIHGHPQGAVSGSRAVIQAVEAAVSGQSLTDYSQNHPELKSSLEKWPEQT